MNLQQWNEAADRACVLCGPQVSLLIRRELFERAKDFNIILDDVAITELSFSREYTAAVEAKQVGESSQRAHPLACVCVCVSRNAIARSRRIYD